ncbi:hypothetical protein [Falsiroseomonas selenitidurans]|uniref:Uncharacterized protein n=1 Tax=Falsiroseomonas selenitidurans TaxID=2716335 RepID=A0ABX1EAK7_9PROT|nr:hypothetical protein [Falsiroseomonas selenitidurans]NKC32817.1 hypothetical protein [Falsiroseomonas selenitidurans]
MALQVGDFTQATGFFTRLIAVVGQPPNELERRLGFHAGRLAQGWMLLALKEAIAPGEFAFAGYTNSAGGRTAATLPSGVTLPVGIDEAMRSRSSEIDRRLGAGWYGAQRSLAESFVLTGPQRIVKVVPRMRHMAAMPDEEQYPPGSGVPQWILLKPKRFIVAAIVRPSAMHLGGGADGPIPARWADPLALGAL